MSKFLYTRNGDFINASQVVRISCGKRQDVDVAHLRDGSSVEISSSSLLDLILKVIPAQPGFNVVFSWLDGEEIRHDLTPVLAWEMEGDRVRRPVSFMPSSQFLDDDNWAVVTPAGTVFTLYEERYESLGEYLASELSRLNEKHRETVKA